MNLTGDTMLSRALVPFAEPDYLALRDVMRDADVSFTNLETTVRTREEGAAVMSLGTPMTTPPALLEDLKWMGVNLVSCANNHATDYGPEGIRATIAHLARSRLSFAGIGVDLGAAREPVYLDTAAGRVALIATSTFFRLPDRAGEKRPDAPGRPGLNPLAFSRSYTVDEDAFAALGRASNALGLTQEGVRQRNAFFSAQEAAKNTKDTLHFLGATFKRGSGFALETRVNAPDAEGNLRAIREARRQADWVIFSLHNHEFGAAGRMTAETDVGLGAPADFVVQFARAAIDAGADVVAGHGPHLTLGVEIYKDRPILYSLGNFILENDTVEVIPAESYARFGLDAEATPADFFDARTDKDTRGFPASAEYWEAVIARCAFCDGRLVALEFVPLDLGFGASRAERGRPLVARGATAARILERVRALSRQHGCNLTISGEIATVSFA